MQWDLDAGRATTRWLWLIAAGTGRKRQLLVIVPSPVMFFLTLAGWPV